MLNNCRGEKLYVTKDKRDKKSCKKPVCWGLTLTVLAAAIFIVVLLSSEFINYISSPDAALGAGERTESWAEALQPFRNEAPGSNPG
jgi:hypothetical protein